MVSETFRINGEKFRVVREKEYQRLCAALRGQERQAQEDAADVAEAERRLRDPKRKTITLAQLEARLKR